ncbi:MAG: hypothetical protein ACKOEV_01725 [Cytophagales bacterium]
MAFKEAKEKGIKYKASLLFNGGTLKELLVRCKYYFTKEDWTVNQKMRAELLFTKYPQLQVAYRLCISLFHRRDSPRTLRHTLQFVNCYPQSHHGCRQADNGKGCDVMNYALMADAIFPKEGIG